VIEEHGTTNLKFLILFRLPSHNLNTDDVIICYVVRVIAR